MRTSLARMTVAALAAVAWIGPAIADTTLVFDDARGQTSTVRLTEGLVRLDGNDQGWMLYRAEEDAAYIVSPADKSYTRIDRAGIAALGGQMDAARAQMERELANLPPEQRAMAEQMMARMLGNTDKPAEPPKPVATGQRRTVNAVDCEDHALSARQGGQSELLCLAQPKALGMSKAENDTVQAMYALLSSLSQATGFAGMPAPAAADLPGVPVLIERDGKARQTLTGVSHESIDRGLYALPDGYTERDASSLR